MGNCRSRPSQQQHQQQQQIITGKKLTVAAVAASATTTPSDNVQLAIDDPSTSALIQAILPVILPIAREVASQRFISQKMILLNEEPVETLDRSHLPVGPVDIALDHITVVSPETLQEDMKGLPEFAWPEQERCESFMRRASTTTTATTSTTSITPPPAKDNEGTMVVLDITGVVVTARLAPGIELALPVDGPLGIKVTLEVGSGGSIPQATVLLEVPKLRIWFVQGERYKVYAAFMARPSIVPFVHVNVDRGHGDFWDVEFNGGGGLDDTIESILCGFGPSSLTHKEQQEQQQDHHGTSSAASKVNAPEKRSWVADALGRRISDALAHFAGLGKDRPLELDLHDAIQAAVDTALGKKTRSVEEIEAHIAELQKELELAKQRQQEQGRQTHTKKAQQRTKALFVLDEKKYEEDSSTVVAVPRYGQENSIAGTVKTKATADVAPSFLFCGIGV